MSINFEILNDNTSISTHKKIYIFFLKCRYAYHLLDMAYATSTYSVAVKCFYYYISYTGLYGAIMRTGKMKDITQFDAEFFQFPPVLAERTDPQQRMLLEVVYETIIDAGIFFKLIIIVT